MILNRKELFRFIDLAPNKIHMTSNHVLILHTTIFSLFALGSLSSPVLVQFFPRFFGSMYFLVGAALLLVIVKSSWKKFGGCPFTVWENKLRNLEQKQTYSESCLPHYSAEWFGLNLTDKFFTPVLIILFLIPIFVGIYAAYFV